MFNTKRSAKLISRIKVPEDIALKNENLRAFVLDLTGETGVSHEEVFEEAKYNERFVLCICESFETHYTDIDAIYFENFLDKLRDATNSVDWKSRFHKVNLGESGVGFTERDLKCHGFDISKIAENGIDGARIVINFDRIYSTSDTISHEIPTVEKINPYYHKERRAQLSTLIEFMTKLMETYGDGYVTIREEECDGNISGVDIAKIDCTLKSEGRDDIVDNFISYHIY